MQRGGTPVLKLHFPQKDTAIPDSTGLSRSSQWLQKNLFPVSLLVVTVLALTLRLTLFPYKSGDYLTYLQKWYAQIEQGGGLPALLKPLQDCNYTIAYLTLLTPFAALHIPALYAVKVLSTGADFALALSCALLLKAVWPNCKRPHLRFIAAYTAVLIFPETYIDSAFWAQCDAIYTTFLVLTVYFLIHHRCVSACAMFGFAFAFKMQAVFLLPLLIISAVCSRWFRLRSLLAMPAALVLTCVPAMLIGTPIWMTFWPYLLQFGCCGSLTVNCPGAGMLLGHLPRSLWQTALIIVVLLCMYAVLALILHSDRHFSPTNLLLLGTWCCLCCVTLLPCMHERYAFPADLLLLILTLYTRCRGDTLCLLTESIVSILSWMQYLDPKAQIVSTVLLSLLRLGCLFWLSLRLWQVFTESHSPQNLSTNTTT